MVDYMVGVDGIHDEDHEGALRNTLNQIVGVDNVDIDAVNNEVNVYLEPNIESRGQQAIVEARVRKAILSSGCDIMNR